MTNDNNKLSIFLYTKINLEVIILLTISKSIIATSHFILKMYKLGIILVFIQVDRKKKFIPLKFAKVYLTQVTYIFAA